MKLYQMSPVLYSAHQSKIVKMWRYFYVVCCLSKLKLYLQPILDEINFNFTEIVSRIDKAKEMA